MGRKLDALLRRNFKTSKFKTILGLAISRLAVVKNQHQVRSSNDRNDTSKLLQQGQNDRALLRVEHVIREQNMLDVLVMIEGYCNLLIERTTLIANQRDCPFELHEAISSLIYASSRSGELPELLEVREMFASRYGRDFISAAVDLRNNCRVNPTMIQKMSTRQPPLEIRKRVLKQIADENGIALNFEEQSPEIREEEVMNFTHQSNPVKTADARRTSENSVELGGVALDEDEHMSASMKTRKRYADVATAAQAAFESAAFAAEAARAAVELSRTESGDDGGSPGPLSGNRHERTQEEGSLRSRSLLGNNPSGVLNADEVRQFEAHQTSDKIHPVENSGSESEHEESPTESVDVLKQEINGKPKGKVQRPAFRSGLDSTTASLKGERGTPILFDESDKDEDENEPRQKPVENHEFYFRQDTSTSKKVNNRSSARGTQPANSRDGPLSGLRKNRQLDALSDEEFSDENGNAKLNYIYRKQSPIESKADSFNQSDEKVENMGFAFGKEIRWKAHQADQSARVSSVYSDSGDELGEKWLKSEKKPISVRSRRGL